MSPIIPAAPQQSIPQQSEKADLKAGRKRSINPNGVQREEQILQRLVNYARSFPQGPLVEILDQKDKETKDKVRDETFASRLEQVVIELTTEMEKADVFENLPERLKAIIFAIENLNLNPVKQSDDKWMKEGTNPSRPGSSSTNAGGWKCNKLTADAYASTEGSAIGDQYPFTRQNNRKEAYMANSLAITKHLSYFPYVELIKLQKDGNHIAEVEEYNEKGEVTARYILDKDVFIKEEKQEGKWIKTGETKSLNDLEPGRTAKIGDIVAFNNIQPNHSGHTGLNLGHDLFISALNITKGVGILSIKMHIDSSFWDHYSKVAFRSYNKSAK